MKPTILGLRTTIYKVSDLAKAKEWYSNVFQTKPYFDEPYYVGFTIAGYELGLQPDDAVKGTNVVSYWGVEHIEEEYARFLELGATAVQKPTDVGDEIMVATVKDPWDNIIGLICNPHFKLS